MVRRQGGHHEELAGQDRRRGVRSKISQQLDQDAALRDRYIHTTWKGKKRRERKERKEKKKNTSGLVTASQGLVDLLACSPPGQQARGFFLFSIRSLGASDRYHRTRTSYCWLSSLKRRMSTSIQKKVSEEPMVKPLYHRSPKRRQCALSHFFHFFREMVTK